MHPLTKMVPTAAATPRAGLLRIALAAAVALLVGWAWPRSEVGLVYLAAGLAAIFGALSLVGRPQVPLRDGLVRVALDCALVGVLVAYTGGGRSPFFSLFLLAALGIVSIEARAKVAAATAVAVGGYLAAVAFAEGSVGPEQGALLKAGLLGIFCVVVGFLGSGMHGLRKLAVGLSSTLANEIDRVEKDEGMISKFGPVLETLSLEETLRWAVETAHSVGGGSYAHSAMLGGSHSTILEGDFDACPSWWHPAIQRLVLWSCREGETVRSEEEIHGIEGFLAVPIGPEGGEKWGALVVGGKEFIAEDERALKLLADVLVPALKNAENAPGGLDQLTRLPNRASFHRVLRRELSRGGALTVLVADLDRSREQHPTLDSATWDASLRRIGVRLRNGRQRVFRHGDEEFAVLLGGADESRARRIAVGIQQLVAEETGGSPTPTVGFALVEGGGEDPNALLGAIRAALRVARGRSEGVAGLPVGALAAAAGPAGNAPAEGIVESLVGALRAKDPEIEAHLRAVSRLAALIGREMSLPREQIETLSIGGLLHDVGKIGIPDLVLHKPGRLTDEEYETIKRHPPLGVEIVSPTEELKPALPAIKYHHERFDGNGYPDGLRGEDIPLVARVVCVVDAFDSMVRERPYGYGVSREAALEEIEDNSGTQFDPRIVRALREVLEDVGDRRADSTG
ncbi:MAG: HD domain-containing protein [Actinomycetota bacterium]|nr:HD domain-containing protein [Actinomycetota bacterium]